TSHLNQLRQLIGGVAPNLGGDAQLAAPPEPAAIPAAEPKQAPQQAEQPRQQAAQPAKQAAPAKQAPQAKKSDEDDEDWWQERPTRPPERGRHGTGESLGAAENTRG